MAAPREVIRMPKMRGINDYPEKAQMGSAQEALNVDFVDGGPSRRRGAALVRSIAPAAGGNKLHGRGLWSWRDSKGSAFHISAHVDSAAGAAVGQGYIQIANAGANDVVASFNLSDVLGGGIPWYFSVGEGVAWTGVPFQPAGQQVMLQQDVFIIGTDWPYVNVRGLDGAALFALFRAPKFGQNGWACAPIGPVDREHPDFENDLHYWGGGAAGVPSETEADDAGPYLGTFPLSEEFKRGRDRKEIGARIVTVYRNRVVVAGFGAAGLVGNRARGRSIVRWANLGDLKANVDVMAIDGVQPGVVQGWPLENYVNVVDRDDSAITALSTWRDYLVIWKHNSIHLARFTGIDDFTMVGQVFGIGHIGAGQPVYHGGVLFFVWEDGIYSFDGKPRYISGPVERRLRRLGGLRNAIGVSHPTSDQVWWLVGSGSGLTPRWFVLHTDSGDWSEMEYNGDFDAAGLLDGSKLGVRGGPWPHVMGADRTGTNALNICRLDTGGADFTHNATAPGDGYDSNWESQRIAYGRHQVRRWKHLRLDQEQADGNDDIQVYWALDNQASGSVRVANSQNALLQTIPGAPGTFGNLTFGNAVFEPGPGHFFHSRTDLSGGPARWCRFGIGQGLPGLADRNVPRWHFTSAELDTRRLEGRR